GSGSRKSSKTDIYGNQIDDDMNESTSWHGGKIYRNAKCQGCDKIKAEIGACRICKECVGKPDMLKRKYDQRKVQILLEKEPKSSVNQGDQNVVSFSEKLKQKERQAREAAKRLAVGEKVVRLAA
ncbi:MAG: hypothetical protein ACHQT9_04990, partial [Candidatus Saccharimonadales bacterium]